MSGEAQLSRIGFIGLGVMGARIARRLIGAASQLTVYDINPANAELLLASGAKLAASCREVASASDFLFTCLPAAADLDAVLFGDAGVLAGAREGSIVIDLSTIGPGAAAQVAARLEERRIGFLDAAMAQGAAAVEQGTLTLLVGGERKIVDRCETLLKRAAGAFFHFGAAGSGQAAKIAYNLSGVGAVAAAAEGVRLLRALGGDLQTFTQMLDTVDANVFFRRPARDVLSGDFSGGFRARLALKDLNLALHAANGTEVSLPVGTAVRDSLAAAVAAGHGEARTSCIALVNP